MLFFFCLFFQSNTSLTFIDIHYNESDRKFKRRKNHIMSCQCITTQHSSYHIHFLLLLSLQPSYVQTLVTLHLSKYSIGDNGAQYIANGIQNNTVTFFLLSSIFYWCALYIQTLITLDLTDNKIEATGAKYLSNLLENNKVTLHSLFYIDRFCYW